MSSPLSFARLKQAWQAFTGTGGASGTQSGTRSLSGSYHPSDPQLASQFVPLPASGIRVDEHGSLGIATVYRCVQLIAGTIATLPLHVSRRGERQADEGHPLHPLLHLSPNAETTSVCWREAVQTAALLWGTGYTQIVWGRGGQVRELIPLEPWRVLPERGRDGRIVYRVRSDGTGRKTGPHSGPYEQILRDDEMLRIPALSLGGLVGLSPIAYHRQTLGRAAALRDFGANFFANQTRPSGLLKYAKRLTKDQRDELREQWQDMHAGPSRAGLPAVLQLGVEWEQLGMPLGDAQYVESEGLSQEQIADIFGVPLFKLRGERGDVEDEQIVWWQDTIATWAAKWEQEIGRKLLRNEATHRARFNFDAYLRVDTQKRAESLKIQAEHGALSPDEWRAVEGRQPWPEGIGESGWMPLNQFPLSRLEEWIAARLAQMVAPKPGPAPQPLPGIPDPPQAAGPAAAGAEGRSSGLLRPEGPSLLAQAEGLGCGGGAPASDATSTWDAQKCLAEPIEHTTRRLLGIQTRAVIRAANNPRSFLPSVEEFFARHEKVVQAELGPLLRAAGRADQIAPIAQKLCQRSLAELLTCAECQPDELAERVNRAAANWPLTRGREVIDGLKEPPLQGGAEPRRP